MNTPDSYMMRFSRKCYYICVFICLLLLAGYLTLCVLHIPLTSVNPFPCLFYETFHLYCPGCGGTRALSVLLQGHFLESIKNHPVIPYSFVLIVSFMISHTLNIFSKGKIKAMLFRPIYLYIMIAIILLQWFVKLFLAIRYQIYVLD